MARIKIISKDDVLTVKINNKFSSFYNKTGWIQLLDYLLNSNGYYVKFNEVNKLVYFDKSQIEILSNLDDLDGLTNINEVL